MCNSVKVTIFIISTVLYLISFENIFLVQLHKPGTHCQKVCTYATLVCINSICKKQYIQQVDDFVTSFNQVTIHFADLASTINLEEKIKSLKSLNLVLAKFMHVKVLILISVDCSVLVWLGSHISMQVLKVCRIHYKY